MGADLIRGGVGDDFLVPDQGADTVSPGEGNDTILSGLVEAATIDGGAGNDIIATGNGADTADGGGGDDVLFLGLGADSMAGGDGIDALGGDFGSDIFADGGSDYFNLTFDIRAGDAELILDLRPGEDFIVLPGHLAGVFTWIASGTDAFGFLQIGSSYWGVLALCVTPAQAATATYYAPKSVIRSDRNSAISDQALAASIRENPGREAGVRRRRHEAFVTVTPQPRARARIMKLSKPSSATCHQRYWSLRKSRIAS